MSKIILFYRGYGTFVPYIYLLVLSILQWLVPTSFKFIGGANFGLFPFMILFGIHLYKEISNWLFLVAYFVFQFYLNIGAEFGFYPFACYLLLITYFLRIDRLDIYQVLRNLMFFYLYGYIVLERLSDEAWQAGYGLWFFTNSAFFQGVFRLPANEALNYISLFFEGVLCILFLFQRFNFACVVGFCLHIILLLTTNIMWWQLFLVTFYLGGIICKEDSLAYTKMRKIIKSFLAKRSKVQS